MSDPPQRLNYVLKDDEYEIERSYYAIDEHGNPVPGIRSECPAVVKSASEMLEYQNHINPTTSFIGLIWENLRNLDCDQLRKLMWEKFRISQYNWNTYVKPSMIRLDLENSLNKVYVGHLSLERSQFEMCVNNAVEIPPGVKWRINSMPSILFNLGLTTDSRNTVLADLYTKLEKDVRQYREYVAKNVIGIVEMLLAPYSSRFKLCEEIIEPVLENPYEAIKKRHKELEKKDKMLKRQKKRTRSISPPKQRKEPSMDEVLGYKRSADEDFVLDIMAHKIRKTIDLENKNENGGSVIGQIDEPTIDRLYFIEMLTCQNDFINLNKDSDGNDICSDAYDNGCDENFEFLLCNEMKKRFNCDFIIHENVSEFDDKENENNGGKSSFMVSSPNTTRSDEL